LTAIRSVNLKRGCRRIDNTQLLWLNLRPLTVGYPSGQRGQTVNLLAYAFDGSNPSPTTISTREGFFSTSWRISLYGNGEPLFSETECLVVVFEEDIKSIIVLSRQSVLHHTLANAFDVNFGTKSQPPRGGNRDALLWRFAARCWTARPFLATLFARAIGSDCRGEFARLCERCT
jgi:hypothetical protein